MFGLETPAALGLGRSAPAAFSATDFPDLEAWQAQLEGQLKRPLTEAEKNALRDLARARWAQANGVPAKVLDAQVHHDDPLQFSHVNADADPNRLSNLVGLQSPAHNMATQAWARFARSLGGRSPTSAELMAQKLQIDKMLEPYVVRPGLPRPPPKPPMGGTR